MALTRFNASGTFGSTPFLVGSIQNGAAYATIAEALLDVSAGSVVIIQPGTYTESITWPANIDVQGSSSSITNPAVTIIGNQTFSNAGELAFYGISFSASSGSIWTTGPSGVGVQNVDFDTCKFENSAGKCLTSVSALGSSSITCNNSNFLSSGDVCLDISNASFAAFNSAVSSITHDGATLGASGNLSLKASFLEATSAYGVVLTDASASFSSEGGNLIAVEPIRFTAAAGASSIRDAFSTSGTNYVSSSIPGPTLVIGLPLFPSGSSIADPNVTVVDVSAGGGGMDINGLTGYPLTVDHGGTGATSLTDHGILLGSGTSAVTVTSAPSDGQLLIGSTGADPVLATLTAGTGISIVNASGSITLSSSGTIPWVLQSASTTLAVNTGYFVSSGALLLALPATSAVGDIIEVSLLDSATSFQITQSAGQQIRVGSTTTTLGAGGTLTSTAFGDSLKLVCYASNTLWQCMSIIGNLTAV